MNYNIIIDKYYPQDNRLKEILMIHSRQVTVRALKVCDLHPELHLDRQFVEEAAMIHDIGIFLCDAPAICCFGKEHYLRHGFLGAELMRKEGYPGHARVCERHTGAGLTVERIIAGHLLLP
ncbi:MAG: phosphohydrolase, partial [Bacteroidota bacterium]|nr:phosphohydrolase [Bacteroidota bacterium]